MYYSLTVFMVRVLPMLYSLAILLNVFLAYFSILPKITIIVNQIFYLGWLGIFALWVYSKTYKFCLYHRLFIYYIVTNQAIMLYDTFVGIKCTDFELFAGYLILAGVFSFAILWAYLKYGDRNLNCKSRV